jgi:SAM-dependent methyltransferase
VTVEDHFKLVASVYDSLRTTDEAPVRRIRELLPDGSVVGLDLGCGTGRYSRLLHGMLPDGSLLAASDVSAAMLAELRAGRDGQVPLVRLRCTAEELPIRTGSLDLVTSFNSVHHFGLGRFLAEAARALRAGGRLFVYTRTPEQNARTLWGRFFPDFAEREQRLHSEAALRDAVDRTHGLQLVHIRSFRHARSSTRDLGLRSRAATTRPSRSTSPTSCAGPSPRSWPACPAPRSAGSTSISWWSRPPAQVGAYQHHQSAPVDERAIEGERRNGRSAKCHAAATLAGVPTCHRRSRADCLVIRRASGRPQRT